MNKKIVVCISILSLYGMTISGMDDKGALNKILSDYQEGALGTKYLNLAKATKEFTGNVDARLDILGKPTLLIELSKDPNPLIFEPIKVLLEKGADPTLKDDFEWSASDYSTVDNVKDLLAKAVEEMKTQPVPTAQPTQKELQEFVRAAYDGDLVKVQEFLAKPENLNHINDFPKDRISGLQLNALMAAVENKKLPVIKELLSRKNVDVNKKNNENGYTALILACQHLANANQISELLKNDTLNVDVADNKGFTALMYAALNDNLISVENLKNKKNANINAVDKDNKTVLNLVNESDLANKNTIIKKLISLGAKTSEDLGIQQPPTPITPPTAVITQQEFVQAAYDDDLAKVQAFLAKPENLNHINEFAKIQTKEGTTRNTNALLAAMEQSHEHIVDELLAHKELDVTRRLQKGFQALYYAVEQQNNNIIQKLLDKGANPNTLDASGRTPLMHAVQLGNIDIVNTLLNAPTKIIINKKTDDDSPKTWRTALWIAIDQTPPNITIIKELLAKGADANVTNKEGKTPLQVAQSKGLTDVVELLEPKAPPKPTPPDLTGLYQQLMQLNDALNTLQYSFS